MQEQGTINTHMCNEAHQVEHDDGKQEYKGPVTRSKAKAKHQIDLSTEKIIDRDK